MNIVAEGFGAIAVVLNFIGYRQTNVDKYLLISAFALSALSVHFFMLDAMAAGIGTLLASVRPAFVTLLPLNIEAMPFYFSLLR